MNQTHQTQDNIELCAAEWVAQMVNGDLTDAEHEALNAWLEQSPDHQQAFADANHALAIMDASLLGNTADQSYVAQDQDKDSTNIQSFPGAVSPQIKEAKSRRTTALGKWTAVALAASLVLVVFSGRVWIGDPSVIWGSDHHTAPGEISTITLEDGSVITLGPDSAINVYFNEIERKIELLSGLADFQATPMEDARNRPFIVSTGDGTSRALGTRFVVEKFEDYASVAVLEHRVQVSLTDSIAAKTPVTVAPNQAVRYSRHALDDVYPINPNRVLSWQKGKLIFDRVALREVVAEFARYQHGKILISNEAAARKLVSGVFDMRDPQIGLDLIAAELSVRKVSLTPLLTILY